METIPGPPTNPYEAPKASLDSAAELAAAIPTELATLGQRLGGACFDLLLGVVASLPLIMGLDSEGLLESSRNGALAMFGAAGVGGILTGLFWLALIVVHCVLVSTRGQSVGKIVAGTRILQENGAPVGFVRGVLLRGFVPALLGAIPLVGTLFRIANPLFIFGAERRCLHDQLAGTKVVTLK